MPRPRCNSTPHKAAFPSASALGTKALLLRTADPVASLAGKTTSGGRLDLSAAVGASPVDTTPLWLRAVAMIANTVAGTRDVMASTKK